MPETRSPRLAVLIDADNTPAKIADRLFEEIAKIGEASVRRIYGDFADERLKGWTDVLPRHAIIPQQQFAYVTGKNATDIALVIDAMDLLYSGRFDGFCLVSSDSDFTRLSLRIREQGSDVFGFGSTKTSESFQRACRRFIHIDNLHQPTPSKAPEPAPTAPAPRSPKTATPIILKAITQIASKDGWVALCGVGSQIASLSPDFDYKAYGSKTLSDLVRNTNAFELDQANGRIRLKPASTKAN